MVYYIIKNVELPFSICLFWDPDGSLYNHVHSTNLGGDIPGSADTILRDSTHNTLVGGDIPGSTDTTLRGSTQGRGDIPAHTKTGVAKPFLPFLFFLFFSLPRHWSWDSSKKKNTKRPDQKENVTVVVTTYPFFVPWSTSLSLSLSNIITIIYCNRTYTS